MDVYALLDQCERLLTLYGYETERDVGITSKGIVTADLTRETARTVPTSSSGKILYRADILAEKKDIERPYGRIIVSYNRTKRSASPTQVAHLAKVMEHAGAYMGILLSVNGASADASAHAANNNIRIFSTEDLETLIGKAAMEKPWWHNVNAWPVYFTYQEMIEKIRHDYEHFLHLQWSVSKIYTQELAYLPYWKIAYQVREKNPAGEDYFGSGMIGINAHSGMIDVWRDADPIQYRDYEGRLYQKGFQGDEVIDVFMKLSHGVVGKIRKPKDFPSGVRFGVYRPALEKNEAKVAGNQWIAYLFNTDPNNVLVTAMDLVYVPFYRFRLDHLPFIKNPWNKTVWFTTMISPLNTDTYNLWKLVGSFKEDIVFYMAEKYLVNMMGAKRYVKTMQWITYKIFCRLLYWDLRIIPSSNWIDVMFVLLFVVMVYGMLTFKSGLMLLVFLAFLFAFIGPGYAFMYVIRSYLKRYPVGSDSAKPKFEQPEILEKLAGKVRGRKAEDMHSKIASEKLDEMYKSGQLSELQKKRYESYLSEIADKQAKKAEKFAEEGD